LSACVAIGSQGYHCDSGYYGKYPSETKIPAGINLTNLSIGPDDVAIFAYLAFNKGHGNMSTNEFDLSNYTAQLAQTGVDKIQDGTLTASNVGLVVPTLDGSTLSDILEFIGANIAGIADLFTEGCDGWVAGGIHGFNGSEICSGSVPLNGTDFSAGNGSTVPTIFGIDGSICNADPSFYKVTWLVNVSHTTEPKASGSSAVSSIEISTWLLAVVAFLGIWLMHSERL
jgi:hypothetical protein